MAYSAGWSEGATTEAIAQPSLQSNAWSFHPAAVTPLCAARALVIAAEVHAALSDVT